MAYTWGAHVCDYDGGVALVVHQREDNDDVTYTTYKCSKCGNQQAPTETGREVGKYEERRK